MAFDHVTSGCMFAARPNAHELETAHASPDVPRPLIRSPLGSGGQAWEMLQYLRQHTTRWDMQWCQGYTLIRKII